MSENTWVGWGQCPTGIVAIAGDSKGPYPVLLCRGRRNQKGGRKIPEEPFQLLAVKGDKRSWEMSCFRGAPRASFPGREILKPQTGEVFWGTCACGFWREAILNVAFITRSEFRSCLECVTHRALCRMMTVVEFWKFFWNESVGSHLAACGACVIRSEEKMLMWLVFFMEWERVSTSFLVFSSSAGRVQRLMF